LALSVPKWRGTKSSLFNLSRFCDFTYPFIFRFAPTLSWCAEHIMDGFVDRLVKDRRYWIKTPLRIRAGFGVSERVAHSESLFRRGVLFITEMSLPLGSNVDSVV
jgi:hypothetical protein